MHLYHASTFRGIAYYRFVPSVRYSPVFYRWAFNPWPAPVYFSWQWKAEPWYPFYGVYFTPSAAYANGAAWLTDYLLAENLRIAYENRQQNADDAPLNDGPGAPISSEVKRLIADEVQSELESEQSAATNGQDVFSDSDATGDAVPPALDPNQRLFVVSTALTVDAGGQACALTPGDIILRMTDAVAGDGTVAVSVLSSKPGDCAINSSTAVDVATLQEMHNQFREQIDSGLRMMAENKGKHGLPHGPSAGTREAKGKWTKPDKNAVSALNQQEAQLNASNGGRDSR
jgi:hypothetical protein